MAVDPKPPFVFFALVLLAGAVFFAYQHADAAERAESHASMAIAAAVAGDQGRVDRELTATESAAQSAGFLLVGALASSALGMFFGLLDIAYRAADRIGQHLVPVPRAEAASQSIQELRPAHGRDSVER